MERPEYAQGLPEAVLQFSTIASLGGMPSGTRLVTPVP